VLEQKGEWYNEGIQMILTASGGKRPSSTDSSIIVFGLYAMERANRTGEPSITIVL
jgi:hypothetical protein